MLDQLQRGGPFVVFVGAGASAMPPSRLPTWTEFNDLLLECLCDLLAEFSDNRQPTAKMLAIFRARRDQTRFFAPDFQAQLIEEEIGADYFRVWQSLDTEIYGPVHAALAELARLGRLAAVVTTNFDRLIETALRKRDVMFEVFHDGPGFATLLHAIDHYVGLPVIKIHGSLEDEASLVDTLKQRVVGRPKPLIKILRALLRRYPWLYLGFSGADFSYDPHYLGILDAAAEARGFLFVAREGGAIQEGVLHLKAAYGEARAEIVQGDLSNWLVGKFAINPTAFPPAATAEGSDNLSQVKDKIRHWASSLGPMSVVNVVYAMLKSSGMEARALWLLRKTWKSYRTPEDLRSKSYPRYNYNYSVTLLETGFIRNPICLADDGSNFPEWKSHADQNAYEFLARSYASHQLLAAGAQLASVLAYRGEVGEAIALAATVTKEALRRKAWLDLCDVAIASVVIYDIVQFFRGPIEQLRRCLRIARKLGDEPRRAMLCAHLGRVLTYAGHFEQADEFINEGTRLAERLGLQPVFLAAQAARGLRLADSRTSLEQAAQAVTTLQEVVDRVHAWDDVPLVTKMDLSQPGNAPNYIKGRHPILCRLLLDLNRAAMFAGNAEVMNGTLDELDEITTQQFLGYCPHYYLAYAQCLLTHGGGETGALVAELISRARLVGNQTGNPWAAQAADQLERSIGAIAPNT